LNISQQRYRKIVETAEEGIWIVNSDKDIVFLNSKLISSLKYPIEAIMGSSAYLLCHSTSTKESLEKHFYEVEKYQSAHIDICMKNQDNDTLWFYINSTLIDLNNEGDQHILSMLTDITQRKQIEEELTKVNERLTHQANFDELTQIANRRYFNLYAMKMWRQALSHQTEFSLALIDIDFFKRYNDHYGHLQGDICLFQVAQVISSSAQREHDLAARYGGEEFVLLFPNTTQLEAIKIIEDLQSNVATLGIEHRMSLMSEIVTLSIGLVTGIPCENILLEDVLRIADESLYIAKKHGRNQYRIAKF
jgi:diguanylate cyclase (GGDEF)-like protein/PAS domain S-box-containing protein